MEQATVVSDARKHDGISWVFAIGITGAVAVAFLLLIPETRHWFVLPTVASGVLVGVDVVAWARKKLDVLEPQALVAVFGIHFLFLAPLLHVTWDHWPVYLSPATDWRFSLGVLSMLNVVGLSLYRVILSLRLAPLRPSAHYIDERRFRLFARLGAFVGVGALGLVVSKFGGLSGYLAVVADDREQLAGNGWLLIVGEAWPLLLFAATLVLRRDQLRNHRLQLLLIFVLFVLLQFFCGGLRGSRSNTLWPVLIAVGMIHLLAGPIRRWTLVLGAAAILAFMQLYGYYKVAGTEGAQALRGDASELSELSAHGVSLESVLLEDFGRTGTQAIIIDRYQRGLVHNVGLGMSYIGDVAALVPRAVLTERLPNKVTFGTDALYGTGSYLSGVRSSRIYGLIGEAILNFGLVGSPVAFLVLSCYVRFATRVYRSAQGFTAQGFTAQGFTAKRFNAERSTSITAGILAPGVSIGAVIMLGSDFDNLIWFAVKHILPLIVVLFLARRVLDHRRTEGQPSEVTSG